MKIFKGTIITCDEKNHIFRYLIEKNGSIEFIGDTLPDIYKDNTVIDLGEKALIPSFTDSHIHFSSYALISSTLDVREATNFKDLSQIIQGYIQSSGCKILLSFGVSAHSVEEQRLITRKELDQIENTIPIMLVKYDGHASVVNSAMLKLLPKKLHKLYGFYSDSGHMLHEAFYATIDYITAKISVISLLSYMLKAVDKMAEKGIGLVHPADGVGFPFDLDVDIIRFIAGGLKNPFAIRLFFQTMEIKKVLKRKLPRIGGCFSTALDGCFGSLDAALSQPYLTEPDNKGILVYSDDTVNRFVQNAHDKGLQVQLHAIGDTAFEQASKAFENAIKNNFRKDHRHSIIHASLTNRNGLERCAQYKINIASQPSLLHLNLEPLSYLKSILGDRAMEISPFRTMLDMGIHVSGGSDAPVTFPDPIFGMYSACNHFNDSQSMSIMEALKMFTYETAWTSFDEKEQGSLEKGKLANMVVLNKNPLSMDRKELTTLKTQTLYLKGEPYKKGQKLSSLLWRSLFNRRKH